MKAKLLVMILIVFVLSSALSLGLGVDETASELAGIFDYVYGVDSGLDENIIAALVKFKTEESFDGVEVDDAGKVFFRMKNNFDVASFSSDKTVKILNQQI